MGDLEDALKRKRSLARAANEEAARASSAGTDSLRELAALLRKYQVPTIDIFKETQVRTVEPTVKSSAFGRKHWLTPTVYDVTYEFVAQGWPLNPPSSDDWGFQKSLQGPAVTDDGRLLDFTWGYAQEYSFSKESVFPERGANSYTRKGDLETRVHLHPRMTNRTEKGIVFSRAGSWNRNFAYFGRKEFIVEAADRLIGTTS